MKEQQMEQEQPRIASLLPAATEIVCALGAQDRLVGVSHECDYPAGLSRLPALTRPRKSFPQGSGAIDRAVREVLADALAVYEVEVDELARVKPSLIVTQDLCDVCAVSLSEVHRALEQTGLVDAQVVSCCPLRLGDVWDDVRRVARALGIEAQGEGVVAELESRVQAIAQRSEGKTRPTVLTIEWIDPVMVGGTWMPELVELAGGRALVTEPGQHAPTLTPQELASLDPDVVLIKPCGFTLERTEKELEAIRDHLPWNAWRAVDDGRVFVADGNAYFNRPGPRLVESLEILAGCVSEDAADFREQHAGSVRRLHKDLTLAPF